MQKLTKNQIIILIIGVILIIGGVIYLLSLPKEEKEVRPIEKEEIGKAEIPEIFSLSGEILKIDPKNNSLIVLSNDQEFQANLNQDTQIKKLGVPANLESTSGVFKPEKKLVGLKDLRIGDKVLIKTTKNIYGKTEFNDVSQIQVLP